MDKYQSRGQGTLTAILGLVLFFVVIDVIITLILVLNIDVKKLFQNNTAPATTDNAQVQVVTDNSAK